MENEDDPGTAYLMSSALSNDLENSSEIPTWVVLVLSGLALVIFFSWIVKDLSALAPSGHKNSLTLPSLPETHPVSDGEWHTPDNATSIFETVGSQTISRIPLGSVLSVENDKGGAEQTGEQQYAGKISATEPDGHSGATMEQESTALPHTSQPETTQDYPDILPALPSDSDPTGAFLVKNNREAGQDIVERTEVPASTGIVATQRRLVSAEELSDAQSIAKKELSVQADGVISLPNSTARTSKAEQTTEDLAAKTTLSQAQLPSTELGALRQLLAEAAAISETEDGQEHVERKRSEELESLVILSSAIRFAPGSKSVNETMTSALNQIEQILAGHPEIMINVIVATNESGDDKQDMLLSQERGRTLIARFVNEGVSLSRLSLKALNDDQLPANSHRVEIQTYTKS